MLLSLIILGLLFYLQYKPNYLYNPLIKQTYIDVAVHPAVMGSREENVTLQCGIVQAIFKSSICKSGAFPMIIDGGINN